MKSFEFRPIGIIKSVFKARFGTPRQPLQVTGATAELTIRRDLQPDLSLQGIEGFSHIWLVFVFHTNTNKIFRPKIHPPRLEGKTIGVFATRTPHRPNPIGLSLVKLEKVVGDTLFLSGVDLIDGTPILDIKPYVAYVESQPEAQQGWIENHEHKFLEVEFYTDFEKDLKELDPSLTEEDCSKLKDLIRDILEKDPRPLVYKDRQHLEEHAIYLDKWNIFFQCSEKNFLITKISIGP